MNPSYMDIIKRNIPKTRRYIKDFGLRISSSVITTIARQIVLLPVLASMLSKTQYGAMLTIVGIMNIISGTLGNSLYSTRLVVDSEYKKSGITGDFNFLSGVSVILSVAALLIIACFMHEIGFITLLLLIPTIALYTANAYLSVWYTIKLEFKKGLRYSIFVSFGTLAGVLFVKGIPLWVIAYLVTSLSGFCFLLLRTGIFKESFQRTRLIKSTISKWGILALAALLTNVVTYLDRLILYPLLGGDTVAIFSTASYFGKAISIIAMPISGVLLGYYAQKSFKMSLKKFWMINAFCGAVLLAFGIFTSFFGEAITGLLFPSLIGEASPYIFIANMSSATAAIIQLVQSASLKYARTFWQIVIQVVYLGMYFGLGILLMKNNGLMGFCYASMIANISRLLMLLVVCHYSIKHNVVAKGMD